MRMLSAQQREVSLVCALLCGGRRDRNPSWTHVGGNQIRNISVLGPVILLVRLRHHALEHLGVAPALVAAPAPAVGAIALGVVGAVLVLVLVARVVRGRGRARPRHGGGRRLGGVLAVPRYVGEVVLVDDGHVGRLVRRRAAVGGRLRRRAASSGWVVGCV